MRARTITLSLSHSRAAFGHGQISEQPTPTVAHCPPERSSINRSKVAGQASWAGNWGEEGGELSPKGRVASELAWPGAGAVQRRVAAPAPGGGPPRVIPYHACHTHVVCVYVVQFSPQVTLRRPGDEAGKGGCPALDASMRLSTYFARQSVSEWVCEARL